MKYILVLLSMVFCHIVDDYYLQGWLASAKQREWWEKNAPQQLYRRDYIMALFMHSFSWSFMIILPIVAFTVLSGRELNVAYEIPYFVNMAIHAVVDDMKANKKRINLIQDQCIHLFQILITWGIWLICIL